MAVLREREVGTREGNKEAHFSLIDTDTLARACACAHACTHTRTRAHSLEMKAEEAFWGEMGA